MEMIAEGMVERPGESGGNKAAWGNRVKKSAMHWRATGFIPVVLVLFEDGHWRATGFIPVVLVLFEDGRDKPGRSPGLAHLPATYRSWPPSTMAYSGSLIATDGLRRIARTS